MEPIFVIIPVFLTLMLLIRIAAGAMDHKRIRAYIRQRGGKVIETNWSPFGPGWFGEKSDRIYRVRYTDRDSNQHKAYCKTSFWTGVYFTEDRILGHAEQPKSQTSLALLQAENQRLREELAQLKRQRG